MRFYVARTLSVAAFCASFIGGLTNVYAQASSVCALPEEPAAQIQIRGPVQDSELATVSVEDKLPIEVVNTSESAATVHLRIRLIDDLGIHEIQRTVGVSGGSSTVMEIGPSDLGIRENLFTTLLWIAGWAETGEGRAHIERRSVNAIWRGGQWLLFDDGFVSQKRGPVLDLADGTQIRQLRWTTNIDKVPTYER